MDSSSTLQLINQLQTLKQQVRLLEADMAEVILEMDRHDAGKDAGHTRLHTLIAEALHIDSHKAKALVDNARQVAETLTTTGHTTPAPLPTVRDAVRDGVVDAEHIHEVAAVVKALPNWVSTQDRELIETTLGTTARTSSPLVVRKHGQILLERINQDGTDPNENQKQAEPKNIFSYTRTSDGRMKFRGELEPEIAEVFQALLIDYSKPQSPKPGVEDPRSAEERQGDAMSDIIDLAANPTPSGGEGRARMILTLDFQALVDAVGTATMESGAPMSASAARRHACEAEMIPMVLGDKSIPLDAGRSRRLVSDKQRFALIARDKGCAIPGCTRPARISEAHHIVEWLHGGKTDLANLVLACRHHHRQLHHGEWRITTERGLPEFIPPPWVDPLQRPIRNILRE